MKVVIVDTTIDNNLIGGGHLYLPGMINGLAAQGHEVHLVTKGTPNEIIKNQIDESKAIVHIKPWGKAGLVEDTAPIFAEWLNVLSPDIYLISGSDDIGWVTLPLINPKIATAMIAHNDSETFYLPLRHYGKFLTKAIGVSPEICEHYISNCKLDPSQVAWIPYGVEVSPKSPIAGSDEKTKMIYVGRLDQEQKRISDLLIIAKKLSAQIDNFKLTIVGDGSEMPNVLASLSDEIKEGKVELCGWLEHDDVIRKFRESEIFILTSAYEGFCIALVEAMANGCCPVVTDIRSGNKRLVDDKSNGFLVPVGDTDTFIERIVWLSEHPNELFEMRINAWNTGEQYSVPRMVEGYEKCFLDAVEAARANPRKISSDFPLMETCRSKYPKWLRRIKLAIMDS